VDQNVKLAFLGGSLIPRDFPATHQPLWVWTSQPQN